MHRETWLDQVQEDILAPDLPICDPHHHLWDYPGSRYLLDELLADTASGHNIVSTVFVECGSMYRADGPAAMWPVGETEFVNGLAAMSAGGGYGKTEAAAGIVGFADLTLGEKAAEVIEAHMAASSRFRGIRHAVAWDASTEIRNSHSNPPKGLLADDAFRRGFSQLAPLGMSFDVWMYHPQLPELTALARAFPDTAIVLDHFGGPLGIGPYAGHRDEIFAQWKPDLARLAECPNVVAKLGGLAMRINGYGFEKGARPATSDELVGASGDYYRHTIDCFGPDRCMFESNFPMDRVSCSYAVLWNAFKKIARDYDDRERAALFHDTAVRVYRLAKRGEAGL